MCESLCLVIFLKPSHLITLHKQCKKKREEGIFYQFPKMEESFQETDSGENCSLELEVGPGVSNVSFTSSVILRLHSEIYRVKNICMYLHIYAHIHTVHIQETFHSSLRTCFQLENTVSQAMTLLKLK